MMILLITVLALAAWLVARPPGGRSGRIRTALRTGHPASRGRTGGPSARNGRRSGASRDTARARLSVLPGKPRQRSRYVPLTVVVQQLAALLKGGRTPSRLWDELWLVYAAEERPGAGPDDVQGLSPASLSMVSVARAAAMRGSPVAEAIRSASAAAFPGSESRERRIWGELAACFDIAAASGCPLAGVLTRLAAQLEVEDDAEAARQTALAGPKATVTLLTWLPVLGLGLGVALGVDPLSILLGTPLGIAALAAGVVLTVAGRIWSARLVRSAIGTS
ncbi:hypothetical protein ASF98_10735 [Arthrobacter sp. Leaf337]|uniref:type II secretion system F family protein n=1 Tax=Arthrobacter sp. Leaf337 TaxID=1736342 RepID=UPI0006FA293F|nr:hypothetical protein [Arthrobacter sp. Leaf337]KQR65569.1 hypothetical protein ASF98_10735 [Arthrobacter sp. Leaf337]